MKSYLKLLLALLLVVTCVFAYVSCGDTGNNPPAGDDTPGTGDDTPGTGDDTPEEPEEEEETYLLDFIYRYTKETINANDRKERKDTINYVETLEIPVNNEGLTAELKAQIEALMWNGYSFDKWYPGYDKTLEVPGVTGEPIDFDTLGPITGDMEFYATRGNLAGKDATWALEEVTNEDESKDTVLTISGTGAMFAFANANNVDIPWGDDITKITKVVIEEGITTVGNNSFSGATALKEVVYASTIEYIGDYAFENCAKLKELTTPANLKTLGTNSYSGCTGLTSVVLNEGLETISSAAFYKANKIKMVILPASLKAVQSDAFSPGASSASHALSEVYTYATEEQFAQVQIDLNNDYLYRLNTVYYYSTDEAAGPYWRFATDKDGNETKTPIKTAFTIKYMLPSYTGNKLHIWLDYVPTRQKLDESGAPVFDENGIPVLEAEITQANVDFVKGRKYHGYEFVKYTVATGEKVHEVGTVITKSLTVNCVVHTASGATGYSGYLSDDGGIKWKFTPVNGVLTVYKDAKVPETEGRNPYEIWDFFGQDDTAWLWQGKNASAKSISTIVIEEGVEYIGRLAFASALSIKSIYIPESVKGIHAEAFAGCAELNGIYCATSDVSTIKLYTGSGETRKEIGDLTDIAELKTQGWFVAGLNAPTAYGKTEAPTAEEGAYWYDVNGTRVAWTLLPTEDGGLELTIGGEEDVKGYATAADAANAPWAGAKDEITHAAFAPHVVSIGANVFNGYSNLQYVKFPTKMTTIAGSAFEGTALLEDYDQYDENGLLIVNKILVRAMDTDFIQIPRGTNMVAGGAFDDCTEIAGMFIPSTIKYIHPDAFAKVAPAVIYYENQQPGWEGISRDLDFATEPFVAYMLDAAPEEGSEITDGYWYFDEFGDYVIVGCAHQWTPWVVLEAPTCTETGLRTHRCEGECQQTVQEVMKALGHNWSEWAPSETLAGKEERYCLNNCGEKETRDEVVEGQIGFVHNFNSGSVADMIKEGKFTTSLTQTTYDPEGSGFVTVKDKGNGDKYLSFGRGKAGGGEAAVIFTGGTNSDLCDPSKIIITWDFIIESDGIPSSSDKDGQWPFRIRFGGTGDASAKQFIIFNDAKGDNNQWTNMDGVYTSTDLKTKASYTIDAKKWHNFLMVYDTTTGFSEMYLNGEFIGYVRPHANYKEGPVKNIDSAQFHTRGQGYVPFGVAVGVDNFAIIPWDSKVTGSEFVFEDQIDVASIIANANGMSVSTGADAVAPDAEYDAAKGAYATLAGEGEDKYVEFGRGSAADVAKFAIIGTPNYTPGTKSLVFTQFDLKAIDLAATAAGQPIKFTLGETKEGKYTAYASVTLEQTAAASKVLKVNGGTATADFAEDVSVAIVYDTVAKTVKVYFNGKYAGDGKIDAQPGTSVNFNTVCFETGAKASYTSVRFGIDNVKYAYINSAYLPVVFVPETDGAGSEGGSTTPEEPTPTPTPTPDANKDSEGYWVVDTAGTPAVDNGKLTFETGTSKDYKDAGKISCSHEDLVAYDETTGKSANFLVVTDGTKKVLRFTKSSKDPRLQVAVDAKSTTGLAYTFETDLYLAAGTAERPDKVVFETYACNAAKNAVWEAGSWSITLEDGKYYLAAAGQKIEIAAKTWVNIKVEAAIVEGKKVSRLYVNGELKANTSEDTTVTSVEAVTYDLRWKWEVTNGAMYLDNMSFVRTDSLPAVPAN